MTDYRFQRVARTPYSEQYAVLDGAEGIGRLDLHFTASDTYATLAVSSALDETAIEELIETIDAELVASADPHREDFVINVWRGEDYGTFAEDPSLGAGEDDEGNDAGGETGRVS